MFNKETLHQIEKLAKINLDDAESQQATEKIYSILSLLDQVSKHDIADLEPLYHPLEISQPWREDHPCDKIERDELQQQAPSVEQGLYLVPKVIE